MQSSLFQQALFLSSYAAKVVFSNARHEQNWEKPCEVQKECDPHPSLASLGDGLLSSVCSQRDEAKM